MALTQLLPTRVRIALGTVRGDARSLVRALRAPRNRGVRVRSSGSSAAVEVPPARPTTARAAPATERTRVGDGGVVVFSESGVTLELSPDETILEAGLRNGVDLLFSCAMGGCGACMLQVHEGEVEYDDPDGICLTEEEVQDGLCLACVGRPRGHVVVEA